jgi:hypothetical protein
MKVMPTPWSKRDLDALITKLAKEIASELKKLPAKKPPTKKAKKRPPKKTK